MMPQHKPILVATDLSPRCDRPIERALMLAEQWQVKLDILHVLDRDRDDDSEALVCEIQDQLETELPQCATNTNIHVMLGSPDKKITNIAKAKDFGLIIMGVSHYDSIGRTLFGSTVDYILNHCEIAILIVKRKPLMPYRGLIVATDYSDGSLSALNTGAMLFPNLPIDVIHSFETPYKAWLKSQSVSDDIRGIEETEMGDFLANKTILSSDYGRINACIKEGPLGRVIKEFAKERTTHLIVLGAHGRSGFISNTIGSNARYLLEHLNNDILLVRAKE